MTSLRRSLQRFAEDLQLFSGQLSQETQELKRNVEHKPLTGATNFRHCLEDINYRLSAVGEELQALESISLDAISLEELVGHCAALYEQNHVAIAQLELRLQQYGYRDVYAPLPPENPLDMLMLRAPAAVQLGPGQGRMQMGASPAHSHAPEEAAHSREPLEHITNSLAAARLQDSAPGSALRPRTAMKAMAPMTAAKGHVRSDTPSSLSSPFEAMSPSMRELLGKYASSTGGPTSQYSGTPFSHSGTPPLMGQLTPAFAAAHLASEEMQAAAEYTPAGSEGHAHTPEAAGTMAGWQADPTMYNALTATAKKLANKPDFLEQYRQRFPHIVASTERLLASVEKQPPPGGPPHAGLHAAEAAGAGPVAALAAAAAAAQHQHHQQQSGLGGPGLSRLGAEAWLAGARHFMEEESTMQLYSQVICTRPLPAGEDYPAPEEEALHAQAAASTTPMRAAGASPGPAATPSTEALLSRAFSATSGQGTGPLPVSAAGLHSHPIAAHRGAGTRSASSAAVAASIARATAVQLAVGAASTAEVAASSVLRSEHSKADLQEAIEEALRRSTGPQPGLPPAPNSEPAAGSFAASAPSMPAASAAAAAVAAAVGMHAPAAAAPLQPRHDPAAASAPAEQQEVPPLRLIAEQEYEGLPTFIKGQLSLEQVNDTLATVHGAVLERAAAGGMAGFTLEDLDALGMGGKAKVFINSIVKLSRAHLKVVYGKGTFYLLL